MDLSIQTSPIYAFPEALLALRFSERQKQSASRNVVVGVNAETLRRFSRQLKFFDSGAAVFTARRLVWFAGAPAMEDELREMMRLLLLLAEQKSGTAVVTAEMLDAPIRPMREFLSGTIRLKPGDELEIADLIQQLSAAGYERVTAVRSIGTFAVRGSLVDVFVPSDTSPVRLDFDDIRLSQIRSFDPLTQESLNQMTEIKIPPISIFDATHPQADAPPAVFRDWFDGCRVYHLDESPEESDLPGAALSFFPTEGEGERFEEPALPPGIASQVEEIRKLATDGWRIALGLPPDLCRRVGDYFKEKKMPVGKISAAGFPETVPAGVSFIEGDLPSGFRDAARKLLLLSAPDLFPRRRGLDTSSDAPEAPTRGYAARSITDVLELSEGDYVVHEQYGIGIFRGLKRIKTRDEEGEYLSIEYRDKDILYVPLDKFHMVQKYIGSGRKPKPHRLGEAAWQKIKLGARKKIEEFARDLLSLYAAREHHSGFAFSQDGVFQHEFEMRFPFDETPDQTKAIAEVKRGMEDSKPMDRLICGDAGFGKTEVALRAAFKAVMDGKQVAVVVPTTLLAEQHRQVFEERFAGFSVKIAELSRFRSADEMSEILAKTRAGEMDICIGTHRLLQSDVAFKDLGLLIIDEEHRFGVRQKERLKFFRQFVDVISMSATPIPRTLYMSLVGTRDISLIETPPRRRIPIQTEIFAYDPRLVREATSREISRGGQVFFLYNRVETIYKAADRFRRDVPEARVGVAHGQMNEEELSKVMDDFHNRRLDVLVTTTIIESGLDLPNANTIFIFDAERFGLSTLYQLRGRVGRSDRTAYCYLLTPEAGKPLTARARRRLEAISAIAGTGGGYRVALEDLTLRGAGNLLGPEQHGIVWEIGFEMYCEMLKSALVELKGMQEEPPWSIRVDIKIPQYIPAEILPDPGERMSLYRRTARCATLADVNELQAMFIDRFGPPLPPLANLLRVRRLKILARDFCITEVIEWNKSLSVYTDSSRAVRTLTAKLRPAQLTPRQIEYNLRGVTADVFLQKFVDSLEKGT